MHYMKSNYNDAMLHLLGGDSSFTEPSSVPIPDGLNQLLEAGFEERNGQVARSTTVKSCS